MKWLSVCALASACASQTPEPEPPTLLVLPAYLAETPETSETPTRPSPPRKPTGVVASANDELTVDGLVLGLTEPISFDVGTATITPVSEAPLEKVAAFMQNHPEVTRLKIEVHTDSRGAETWNLDLSARRAAAIASFLARRGVVCSRLLPIGFGDTRPLESNDTERGRLQNRRTSFRIAEVRGRATGPADGGGRAGDVPCGS